MPDQDINSLDPETYHRVVAPALQVAAEVAAGRGDPQLYNDMASMLALMALVAGLCECLRADGECDDGTQQALAQAPMGACVMVLQESALADAQINDCLWALSAAYAQLSEQGVIGSERRLVRDAWAHLHQDERVAARGVLGLAAAAVVAAVDDWEQARS